jgi:hypothetical protein
MDTYIKYASLVQKGVEIKYASTKKEIATLNLNDTKPDSKDRQQLENKIDTEKVATKSTN